MTTMTLLGFPFCLGVRLAQISSAVSPDSKGKADGCVHYRHGHPCQFIPSGHAGSESSFAQPLTRFTAKILVRESLCHSSLQYSLPREK